MELSESTLSAISKPTFLLQSHSQFIQPLTTEPLSGYNSHTRTNIACDTRADWRVDGATSLGRQFYIIPQRLLPDLVPLRIDAYLPDQRDHPPALRGVLESSMSVVLRNGRDIASLGISQLLCQALSLHCSQHPTFLKEYETLPFGSCLVFDKVALDVSEMKLTIVPAHSLERQTMPMDKLKQLWKDEIHSDDWPKEIALSRLQLIQQIHDTISLVSVKDSPYDDARYIFKSNITDVPCLYHELKFLLRSKSHPHIIGRPLYVVTKTSCFGSKRGVYGFLLPYYSAGSLRDIIPRRSLSGQLSLSDRLRWSKQITSALMHVRDSCETFYSDLRPDNILLRRSQELGDGEDVVLIDFEQRGNWYEWCAPEVRYRMYVEHIRSAALPVDDGATNWRDLQTFLSAFDMHGLRSPLIQQKGPNEPNGPSWNPAWYSLTVEAREKATVYSLGLLLYCIFEGTSNPNISLVNAWPFEPHIEFPAFMSTPPDIQTCIMRCTVDTPEWSSADRRFTADACVGQKMFTRERDKIVVRACKSGGEPKDVLNEVTLGWTEELMRAARFYASPEWLQGSVGQTRPTLNGVLKMLETASLD